MPASPSCRILRSLCASGPVMPHFEEPACQRPRQATFWRRWEPAAPSSDFLASLGASGSVKRLFSATYDPAASSCRMTENNKQRAQPSV